MELIDLHQHILTNSTTTKKKSILNSNSKLQSYVSSVEPNHITNNSFAEFTTILTNFQGRNVINKIKIHQNKQIRFMIQLINSVFIKCKTSHQKILVLKYFLKHNRRSNPYYFQLNPISGEVNFLMNFAFATSQKLQLIIIIHELLQQLIDIFDTLKLEFRKLLEILDQQLNDQHLSEINLKKNIFDKQLKSYIISSPHYAWNIFQKKSQSNKFDYQHTSCYSQKKKIFRCMKNVISQNQRIEKFSQIFNYKKQNIFPIFKLKASQDEQLNKNYLKLSKFSKKQSKLINQITVNSNETLQISGKNEIKINTEEFGKIKIHIQQKKNKQSVIYEKKLISQFPFYEFIGLPKYYFLKQKGLLPNSNFVITNLYQCKNLRSFIQSNSKSLSYDTKLQLLIQISKAMKYLKDNFALYHNLSPDKVQIKKGMIIKLTDFTSSYHQNIINDKQNQNSNIPYQPFVNKFPYVSNIRYGKYNSIQNQKSDSYSLGALMYQVLYSTNFLQIKQSTLKSLDQRKIFKILSKSYPKTLADTKRNNIQSKLLIKFMLDSISHQRKKKIRFSLNQQFEEHQNISLSQRPYLDWFPIILSYTYQHNLSIFN